ncbi:cytochrome P450 6k1-like [Planococcus citri]|uniref:cytochrome P450 6k1-like n=1 Tax=Planococcus citri TaxID=170843 RepID=UPI0031F8AE29
MYLYNSVILLIISSVLYLYWYLKKTYSFFEQHGIPYIKPTFVFGNLTDVILLRKSMAEAFADLYKSLEPHKFAGIYAGTKPMIMIRDPELLKDILIKDFAYFSDRGFNVDQTLEPLSYNLFLMKGDEWRNLRMKLTTTFTTGKMKMMFPLVQRCAEKFQKVIDNTPSHESIDIKDLAARYTTDVIGSCAFGLDTNSLENPDSEFRMMGKKLLQFRFRSLLRFLQLNIPAKLIKLFNITLVDVKYQNFFGETVYKTIDYREKNNVVRKDLLDLLIGLKSEKSSDLPKDATEQEDLQKFLDGVGGDKDGKNNLKITDELLAAQALLFFLAGFETSSTNLCYVLFELSQNEHIQDKVRQEINDVISANDGQLNYDVLKQMTYVDMVIEESLRKYPPLSILSRRTSQNYKIRDSDVVIPAETSIIVSVYGIHSDEKYYDNPQEFRPERFTEEEKSKRPNFTYLPFGEGPRYCIGARFAKLNVKMGLIYALRNFSYQVSPKMKFPIEFDKNFGLLAPSNSVLIQREKLNDY